MRINPVNLNQALSRTQSAGVGAVPRVIAKPASVQANEVDGLELTEISAGKVPIKKRSKKKSKHRGKFNADGLGGQVDIWA